MPLRIVRRPRSPYWIVRGTIRGIRVEESTGIASRTVAEEIRAKREAEIIAQSIHGRSVTATFAEACASYLETGGRHRTGGSPRFLAPILDYFTTTALAAINLDAIEKAAKKLYPDATPQTRNRQVFTPTVAVLRHAATRGWCAMPIVARPQQPQDRVRWLKPDEAERLIDGAGKTLRPLLIFLLYTGARIGEALWLDWHDIDLSRSHVTFPKTKNGEARGVPLHPRVVAALANLKHREGEVFRRPGGEPYERPKRIDDTSAGTRISKAFAGAVERAGLEDFTPHDCRHTWATWHYAANRDLGALQKLGGWKSIKMVLRYAHVNVGELARTIDRLPGGNLGDSGAAEEKKA
jgi:integrase